MLEGHVGVEKALVFNERGLSLLDSVEMKIRNRFAPIMSEVSFLGDLSFLSLESGVYTYTAHFEATASREKDIRSTLTSVSLDVMEELSLDGFSIRAVIR